MAVRCVASRSVGYSRFVQEHRCSVRGCDGPGAQVLEEPSRPPVRTTRRAEQFFHLRSEVFVHEHHSRHGGYSHRLETHGGHHPSCLAPEPEHQVTTCAGSAESGDERRERSSLGFAVGLLRQHADVAIEHELADRRPSGQHRERQRDIAAEARLARRRDEQRPETHQVVANDIDRGAAWWSRGVECVGQGTSGCARLEDNTECPGADGRSFPNGPQRVVCERTRERHRVAPQEPHGVCHESGSRCRRRQDVAAGGISLEPRTWTHASVVQQRIEQRVSQCCEGSAPVRTGDLVGLAACGLDLQAYRLACGDIDPRVGAGREKSIGERVKHVDARRILQEIAHRDRAAFCRLRVARGCRMAQKLRIQLGPHGAISHRWRIARPRAHRHSRGHPRRALHRHRGDYPRVAPQAGRYGRGRRMMIESDRAEIISGVRAGETIGGPIAMMIENRDWPNWQQTMHVQPEAPEGATGARRAPVSRPRPGHADLAGVAKFGRTDVRDVLERASARETAARVAAGAVARQLLLRAGVKITSHVFAIGATRLARRHSRVLRPRRALADDAPLRCVDPDLERRMMQEIDDAREAGDTRGGAFEVIATGVPVGLGSYTQWDRKLDGRLAQATHVNPRDQGGGRRSGARCSEPPRLTRSR